MKASMMVIIIVLISASVSVAQDTPSPATPVQQKVLRFQKMVGRVVQIEYSELGKLEFTANESIKFETSYSCYVPEKSKFVKALRLTTERKNAPSSGGIFYIDFDELLDLSNAISAMVAISTKSSDEEKPFSEITYHTLDGFEIGFTHIGKDQNGYIKMAPAGGDYASLKLELLSALKQLVDKGIIKLRAK